MTEASLRASHGMNPIGMLNGSNSGQFNPNINLSLSNQPQPRLT